MAVRAKFKVESVQEHRNSSDGDAGPVTGQDITFSAVYGEDGSANAEWSKWTPSGQLRMYVTNERVFGEFEAGREYYLDFTPAD